MLQPGDAAPDFRLSSDTGEVLSPAALRGRRWVLFFYPRDATPG